MGEIKIPILSYHSHHVMGSTYEKNDHIALSDDLRTIHAEGFKIVPLRWLVDWFLGRRNQRDKAIAITFDDGCDLDWIDFNHPQHGFTRSFRAILEEFKVEAGNEQPHLQASCFVIGSPTARGEIDDKAYGGSDILNDYWWKSAENSGILKIYNHGWDHNYPFIECVHRKNNARGIFNNIDTYEECQDEVQRAAEYIGQQIYPSWPDLFAYPYGESSGYIKEIYFPQFTEQHKTIAAFGASGGYLTKGSFRWDLPRFVYGNLPPLGWRTTAELRDILYAAG
jgi:peptidoglycan/xylan/chitin deacetylase (PgdA/CDA1 family)